MIGTITHGDFPWDWEDDLRKVEYCMQNFPEVGEVSCDGMSSGYKISRDGEGIL